MSSKITRVNLKYMSQYSNMEVFIPLQVSQIGNDYILGNCSGDMQDPNTVQVKVKSVTQFEQGKTYEFQVKVNYQGVIGEVVDAAIFEGLDFNTDEKFDFESYNTLMDLWHGKYSHLFK